MADPKQTSDNFDKEFSMKQKTKSAPRGKLPSWIMILAGVAAIGGAVAARQPVIRPVENGTKASVNVTDNTLVVDNAGYTGMNDRKADSAELEAFFGAQTGSGNPITTDGRIIYTADHEPFSMSVIPLELDDEGLIVPPEDPDQDAAIYWVDDKPYAVTIKPADVTAEAGNEKEFTEYSIGDEEYTVLLEKLSAEEASELTENEKAGVIQVGGDAYKLNLKAAGNPEPSDVSAPEENRNTDLPEKAEVSGDSGKSTDTALADTDKPVSADNEKAEQSQKSEVPANTEKSADNEPADTEKPVSEVNEKTESAEKDEISGDTKRSAEGTPSVTDKPAASDPEAGSGGDPDISKASDSSGSEASSKPESPADVPDGDPVTEDDENSVITWVDEKPYKVEVKPVSAADEKNEPVKLVDGSKPEKETAAVFEVDGNKYEVQLTEADPEKLPTEKTDAPIIWADKVPFEVAVSSAGSAEEKPAAEDGSIEIILSPVAEEKLPALMKEHFGDAYQPAPTPEPTAVPEVNEPEPEPEPDPEPEKTDDNWFVSIFHNIFGAEPAATPTPQVTVIPVSTEPAPEEKPAPEPIVVRVVPAAAPVVEKESPVAPDEPNADDGGIGMFDPSAGTGDEEKNDPAVQDNGEKDVTAEQKSKEDVTDEQKTEDDGTAEQKTEEDGTAEQKTEEDNSETQISESASDLPEEKNTDDVAAKSNDTDDQSMIVIKPTRGPEPVKLSPTVVPEQEELPHTGMADGWNIPSMLALFAGLMLLIIGIRRLRSRE